MSSWQDTGTDADKRQEVTLGVILRLALPALGVLAATPVYLLLDTAVVGRLGTGELAALGAASTLFAMVTAQLTFLSYGTTARSSRNFGAGDITGAVAEGVQATWMAWIVGGMLCIVMFVGAPTFATWLAADPTVGNEAARWLRITCWEIPLVLTTMAGNGWMRGVQNTRTPLYYTLAGVIPSAVLVPILVNRMGFVGSAWANLVGVVITSACFLAGLARRHEGSWRPHPELMKAQLVLGRDLIVRSAAFQLAFLSAASVAGRFGDASLAGHQVLLQLWEFLTLTLDSLAIAAQALVGAALGTAAINEARRVGTAAIRYSTMLGLIMATVLAAGYSVIPRLFTKNDVVLDAMRYPWWILVALVVAGSVVFAIDGVLLGAADARFLRGATLFAVIVGFIPGVWLALFLDIGLTGVWCGLFAFLTLRLLAVTWRFRSMRWARQ